jgi:hypothetical protein
LGNKPKTESLQLIFALTILCCVCLGGGWVRRERVFLFDKILKYFQIGVGCGWHLNEAGSLTTLPILFSSQLPNNLIIYSSLMYCFMNGVFCNLVVGKIREIIGGPPMSANIPSVCLFINLQSTLLWVVLFCLEYN